MLITGAGGFAGYHLIAAGLASDSGVFVAASPASMIKRASGMTRKKKVYNMTRLMQDVLKILHLPQFPVPKTEIAQLYKLHLKSLKSFNFQCNKQAVSDV
jgi:hypothetical protein